MANKNVFAPSAGCPACGFDKGADKIVPQGYGATDPIADERSKHTNVYDTQYVNSGVRKTPDPRTLSGGYRVGFFGIQPGSQIYRGVLQDGQWVKGRNVTLPGRWDGASYIADSIAATQVYVILTPAGDRYSVTAVVGSVGPDGVIFVNADPFDRFATPLSLSGIQTQLLGRFDSPIPPASKKLY